MAEKNDGFIHRSSSEQAEENDERARTPGGSNVQAQSVSLTGHTGEAEVAEDEETGKVVGAHTTTVITDPESELAVQVPDPEVHPGANATEENPLGVHAEPSPNEVAAGDGEPTSEVGEPTSEVGESTDAPAASIRDPDESEPSDEN